MKQKDLVSIIIPTYNRANTIVESIKSVINQTYNNIELIIIDDGSTDDTRKTINATINDQRIKFYKQPHRGASAARNYGIKKAKGAYIAFQDSDDLWTKNKLSLQLKILKDQEADIVFCKKKCKNYETKNQKNYKKGFLEKNSSTVCISTPTLLLKKEVFDDCLFDEDLEKWQDAEFLYRALKKFKIYSMKENLVIYRMQPDSISNNKNNVLKTMQTIYKKHPEIHLISPEMSNEMARAILTFPSKGKTKDEYLLIRKLTTNKYLRLKSLLNLLKLLKPLKKIKHHIKN